LKYGSRMELLVKSDDIVWKDSMEEPAINR
jgi:hypothetical protein